MQKPEYVHLESVVTQTGVNEFIMMTNASIPRPSMLVPDDCIEHVVLQILVLGSSTTVFSTASDGVRNKTASATPSRVATEAFYH